MSDAFNRTGRLNFLCSKTEKEKRENMWVNLVSNASVKVYDVICLKIYINEAHVLVLAFSVYNHLRRTQQTWIDC